MRFTGEVPGQRAPRHARHDERSRAITEVKRPRAAHVPAVVGRAVESGMQAGETLEFVARGVAVVGARGAIQFDDEFTAVVLAGACGHPISRADREKSRLATFGESP